MDYFCSNCGKPTKPTLCYVGVSADCCEEAPLMVRHEDCGDPSCLATLTTAEEADLIEELTAEEQGEWTDAMRARNDWLNRS